MPVEVLMPALSPTMTEGTLLRWVKEQGQKVVSGEVLAEIETDKATMEIEAVDEGILARILVSQGTSHVAVNTPIALILEEGEEETVLEAYEKSNEPVGPRIQDSSESSGHTHAETSALSTLKTSPELSSPSASSASPASATSSTSTGSGASRLKASPLARRLATQQGIVLESVTGTGPGGRIIKRDIETAGTTVQKQKVPDFSTACHGEAIQDHKDVPVSSMRKVIAQRLTESKHQVPHFYLTVTCVLDTLLEHRQSLNSFLEKQGIKVSVNDMMIKACALALQKVPEANAMWGGDVIRYFRSSDISVAVALEGGLITPIVREAHLKSLSQIAVEMKSLAQKAREGKLKPHEFQGGTFSLSNLGMYGIQNFSAIINPPQGGILAVGAGEQRPIVRDGHITVATVMACTLSVDHRVIDGSVAAQFLGMIKNFVENPFLMMA